MSDGAVKDAQGLKLSRVQTQLNSVFLRAIAKIEKEDRGHVYSQGAADLTNPDSYTIEEMKKDIEGNRLVVTDFN